MQKEDLNKILRMARVFDENIIELDLGEERKKEYLIGFLQSLKQVVGFVHKYNGAKKLYQEIAFMRLDPRLKADYLNFIHKNYLSN